MNGPLEAESYVVGTDLLSMKLQSRVQSEALLEMEKKSSTLQEYELKDAQDAYLFPTVSNSPIEL